MIEILSFGARHGFPKDAPGAVVDCRVLKNPHNVDALRALTGKDKEVQDYVLASSRAEDLIAYAMITAKNNNAVQFCCYGGRHRSVAIAEITAARLREKGYPVNVHHRDLPPLHG